MPDLIALRGIEDGSGLSAAIIRGDDVFIACKGIGAKSHTPVFRVSKL